MSPLRTRKPTGSVTYPLVLFEGEEKAGKTYAALALSASPKVGRTFAFDMGEGVLDEYAPLGPYEIVEHNGTFGDFLEQLRIAAKEPSPDPEKPNVIVIDTVSTIWRLLCDWADGRARSSSKNLNVLKKDPNAEITITMNLWNDAKERWRQMMTVLLTYPGIVIVTARGQEVTEVDDAGNPTKGKVWTVQAEKTLSFDASAIVRFRRPRTATLIAARSLYVDVPSNGLTLEPNGVAEHLIFELLGAGGSFTPRDPRLAEVGVASADAKSRLLAVLAASGYSEDDAKKTASEVWSECGFNGVKEITQAQYAEALAKLREKVDTPPEPPSSTTEKTDPDPDGGVDDEPTAGVPSTTQADDGASE